MYGFFYRSTSFKFYFILFISLFFVRLLAAQPNFSKIKFKNKSSGIGVKIFRKGKGIRPKKEDRVHLTYSFFSFSDSLGLNTITQADKKSFLLGTEEVLSGWDLGVALLRVGDSAALKIPPGLGYGSKKVGKILPNSNLFFLVRLDSVEKIFFDNANKDTISFHSGLKKIINTQGKGEVIKIADEVTLNFTGYVCSNKGTKQIFESSKTNSIPAVIQVGIGKFVTGLDEGISTMRVGEKSTFIVPPKLGYGEIKAGKIAPNSILYYDIEIIKTENPFYNSKHNQVIWIEDSIKIDWLDRKEGEPISGRDVLLYHYNTYYKNQKGCFVEFDKVYKTNNTKILRPGSGTAFPGIEKALFYMKKGDKATVMIPSKVNLMKNNMPFLPKNADVYFDIHIEDVKPYPFLELDNNDTAKTKNNLLMITSGKSVGIDSVRNGSKVNMAFTVYYFNQNKNRVIVDGSRDNGGKPYSFIVGEGKTIKGVEDGVLGMKKGQTRRLILPPDLAYGIEGLPEKGIPPNTTLIFDVEFIDFINP